MSDLPPSGNLVSRFVSRLVSPAVMNRLILALLPASILVGVTSSILWGDNGLQAQKELRAELQMAQDELARTERDNQRLLRELELLRLDPVVVERLIAEELRWGRPGTQLFVFETAPGAP
jgi:cell division protein FtsB